MGFPVPPPLKDYGEVSLLAPSQLEAHSTRRTAPFTQEPGFYNPASLWLYGNAKLLGPNLGFIDETAQATFSDSDLVHVEQEAESIVWQGKTPVTGIHNLKHQRAAIVPLRWGAPRILVVHGGFYAHLGEELSVEPFPEARMWRYAFDPLSDLIVSRQVPTTPKSTKKHLPSIDALIRRIALQQFEGVLFH